MPGFDKPLSLWQVTVDGQQREMAMVRRIGLKAQMVDPANPGPPVSVDVKGMTPVQKLTVATQNYTDPLTRFNFLTFLKNSVFVTFVATLLTLIVNAMAAFALSKYKFAGDTTVFVIIISTLMIPLAVVMVLKPISSSSGSGLPTISGASSCRRSPLRPPSSCCGNIC